MSSIDTGHLSCAESPLHALARQFEQHHEPLRFELSLVERLAAHELARFDACPPERLSQVHLAITLLRDAVLSHFQHEEALLYPSVRLLEDGAGKWALDLRQLLPQLEQEHRHIRGLLAEMRLVTLCYSPVRSSRARMIYGALASLTTRLEALFADEQQTLYPRALALQHDRPPVRREV